MAKVFIFENDPEIQEPLKAFLEKDGEHEVQGGTDPDIALKRIGEFRPDIVFAEFLDILGGWLCREIKKNPVLRETIVILTSRTGKCPIEHIRAQASNYGANAYLPKPIKFQDVKDAIEGFVWDRDERP